jgi:hypothetical protein
MFSPLFTTCDIGITASEFPAIVMPGTIAVELPTLPAEGTKNTDAEAGVEVGLERIISLIIPVAPVEGV